ncbi:MAG: hypothetical protein K0R54_5643 [Clostridiaceae bacterium]|jgi:serine O-acetyltransferase|nr:hypothetical protein [Clostridiaceae bacterium]
MGSKDKINFVQEIKKELKKNKGIKTKIVLFTYRIGFYGKYICKIKIVRYINSIIYIFLKILCNFLGCVDIPPKDVYIGWGLRLPHHFDGIKIMDNCTIGHNCTIFQNVTLGIIEKDKANIDIGNNVYIGAYALILGKVKIGDNCKIGAGTIIINKNIPSNTTIVNEINYKIIPHEIDSQ